MATVGWKRCDTTHSGVDSLANPPRCHVSLPGPGVPCVSLLIPHNRGESSYPQLHVANALGSATILRTHPRPSSTVSCSD